jgi:hypothetical protein
MTYFNQKEEVIQIELTQYGKYLLSRGKLKPAYYAFFDDDIIYDARYAGVDENGGTAVERIKSIPRTKTQYVFTGIEEQVKKNLELIRNNRESISSIKFLPTADKHHVLNKRLGTSFLGDVKAPSLNITMLSGEIQSTVLLQTGSLDNIPLVKIPLLNLKDTEYTISAKKQNEIIPGDNVKQLKTYADGTALVLNEDYILIEIIEGNVENEMKNFDVEMFLCEEDPSTGEETYTTLYFDKKYEDYKNGILLDPQETDPETKSILEQEKSADQLRVQNYFNILVDEEIEKNLICKLLTNVKQQNNLYDPQFDCSEHDEAEEQKRRQQEVQDLYSPSYNENDVKKC